jgi:hypothetical protein
MAEMNAERAAEKAEELAEIGMQMAELLSQAREILRGTGLIGERAKAYWVGHVAIALSDDNEYCGRSMCTLDDTVNELNAFGDDGEF